MRRSPGKNNLHNLDGKNSTTLGQTQQNSGFQGFQGISSFGAQPKSDKPADPLLQRLNQICDSYKSPATTSFGIGGYGAPAQTETYKFSSIVYNISTGTMAPQKPGGISQEDWQKEVAKASQYPMVNGDKMVPSLLIGFDQLEKRFDQQTEIITNMQKRLGVMKNDIKRIRQRYDDDFIDLIQKISANNRKISEKLMMVLQKKEIVSNPELAFSPQEHDLFDKLQKLENELSKPNKFKSALNALNLKAMMIRESSPYYPDVKITDKTEEAEAIIKSNHDAITSLVNIISKTQKTTTILEKTYQEKIQTYIDSFNSYT